MSHGYEVTYRMYDLANEGVAGEVTEIGGFDGRGGDGSGGVYTMAGNRVWLEGSGGEPQTTPDERALAERIAEAYERAQRVYRDGELPTMSNNLDMWNSTPSLA